MKGQVLCWPFLPAGQRDGQDEEVLQAVRQEHHQEYEEGPCGGGQVPEVPHLQGVCPVPCEALPQAAEPPLGALLCPVHALPPQVPRRCQDWHHRGGQVGTYSWRNFHKVLVIACKCFILVACRRIWPKSFSDELKKKYLKRQCDRDNPADRQNNKKLHTILTFFNFQKDIGNSFLFIGSFFNAGSKRQYYRTNPSLSSDAVPLFWDILEHWAREFITMKLILLANTNYI